MRLWSLHPCYLDKQGLDELWRETVEAIVSIQNPNDDCYKHPQLDRFKSYLDPVIALVEYANFIYLESCSKCYSYDFSKVEEKVNKEKIKKWYDLKYDNIIIPVSWAQLDYEAHSLSCKLLKRGSLKEYDKIQDDFSKGYIISNEIFSSHPGRAIEYWEKIILPYQ